MPEQTRRQLLAGTAALAAAALASADSTTSQTQPSGGLHILAIGAHPGDPEAGCGGLMARFAQRGHKVTALYLTRGQAGIPGKTADQAGAIRSAEAKTACKILGATPVFAGQMDAAADAGSASQEQFTKLLLSLSADLVLTQWPIDHHPDHRACAGLTLGAWGHLGRKIGLYYYEVDLGSDTQCFKPTHYVDVTDTEPLKRQACMAHASQGPDGFYNHDHVPMMRFRGMESGHKLAEALIHHDQSSDILPRD